MRLSHLDVSKNILNEDGLMHISSWIKKGRINVSDTDKDKVEDSHDNESSSNEECSCHVSSCSSSDHTSLDIKQNQTITTNNQPTTNNQDQTHVHDHNHEKAEADYFGGPSSELISINLS